ncbi:MAG: DUF6263 family protein [Candidatus Kapabacteria bacterium]|nr:DUF6263 family protein [Candidatus Kapabacteria bacterium]
MKVLKVLIIFTCLFCTILLSCSEKEQPKENIKGKEKVTEIKEQSQKSNENGIKLNFKFQKDKNYFLKINIEQQMSQTIEGQKQEIKQKMGVGYAFKVLENYADSLYSIEVKFNSIYQEIEGPTGKVTYDSKKKDNVESPFTMIFPKIIGKKLFVELRPNGEIKTVKGEKELVDAVLKALDVTNESIREELGRSIRQQFGAKSIKDMLEHSWAYLGDENRKVGDSWKQSHSISGGLPIMVNNNWTLNEIQNNEIILGLKSSLKTDEKNPYSQMGILKVKYELNGSQDGIYKLDRNTCWLLRGEINQKISGKVILEKSKDNPEEKSWPLSVTSKYIIEASE